MAEETKEVPQIGIGDLEACVQIIDACSQRGAFRGDELASVGAIRDKINTFVLANKANIEKETAASAPESPAAATADGTQAELPFPTEIEGGQLNDS